MKKILLLIFFLCCICCGLFAQSFVGNISLISRSKSKHQSFYKKNPPPFLAIYQKNGKTLVLLAAVHGTQSIPAVHYAFDKYHPQVALIEPTQFPCAEAEDAYTAALSAKNKIPVVHADADTAQQWEYAKQHGFSYEDFQMLWIIRNAYAFASQEGKQTNAAQEISDYKRDIHNPAWGELFTEDRLLAYFQHHYNRDFNTTDFVQLFHKLMAVSPEKWVQKTPFYRIVNINPDARSVRLFENIVAALNEYEVVFSEMGAGHFVDIHKALKKMLGKPHYITADQIPPQELWQDCSLDGLQEKVLIKD